MHYFDRPVIIAMLGVRMMQLPLNQIVQMFARTVFVIVVGVRCRMVSVHRGN